MQPFISGGLVSRDFLEMTDSLRTRAAFDVALAREYRRTRARALTVLGPTSGAAVVFDSAARPLVRWLGWTDARASRHGGAIWTSLAAPGGGPIGLLVLAWGQLSAEAGRMAVRLTLTEGWRWAMATDGRTLRVIDPLRGEAARHLDFDLDGCGADEAALWWLRQLASPVAYRGSDAESLEQMVRASDAHGVRVCRALRTGVTSALGTLAAAMLQAAGTRRNAALAASYADALTTVYRVLFLLFAEARRLVPMWHPVYRDGYSIEALRSRLEDGMPVCGTWETLQAIARLAHSGCDAGDLQVTAFNGRLFAPARAPLLDHVRLDDDSVARALAALCLVQHAGSTRRISYAELGVEELGSVYESLLDLEPSRPAPRSAPAAVSLRASSARARKTTGTFYTPRTLADHVVRSTLRPLTATRTPDEILAIRVLDPAMGSGTFLVAACRFLGQEWERALIAAGEASPGDISDEDRATARRAIALRCLFGVDRNPMAVQLGQLSLWLATLAADRPLSFLDHHLVAGDSLLGSSPVDLIRRPPGGRTHGGPLPLESLFDWSESLSGIVPVRRRLERERDDTADIVRAKEATLLALSGDASLARWRAACDLWCAGWCRDAPDRRLYHALLDHVLGRIHRLPPALARQLEAAQDQARALSCFHWPLEFPEVFLDEDGRPRLNGGFDAVVGNPPWEMLRDDGGRSKSDPGRAAVRFARDSGVYSAQGSGHANQYQLFVERALSLTRRGGRIGLIVPGGLLADAGSARLRHMLVNDCSLDELVVFDNRRAIFPIHRGVRFVSFTATRGPRTSVVQCRFRVDDPGTLDTLASAGHSSETVLVTRELLERVGGPSLAIPDLPSARDAQILDTLTSRHPALGDSGGWGVSFGRELNATDDRDCIRAGPARRHDLPIVEGKHLAPFRVVLPGSRRHAARQAVAARLGARASYSRPRLAYRDVASSSNRVTLIAAIVPAEAVTVHTVFCLRTPLALRLQHVLCAVLNSYVANYLARRWVSTHVTTAIVARLPVPVCTTHPVFDELAHHAQALSREPDADRHAEVQAAAAEAYGLTECEFEHILATFPLVPQEERSKVLASFRLRTPQ